jgi:hypothetical protein
VAVAAVIVRQWWVGEQRAEAREARADGTERVDTKLG